MGALLEKPKTEKYSEQGSGNGLRYGLSSMQGWRVEMEDAHTALAGLQGDLKKWSFFGVFDGHAGGRVSAHCSEHLVSSILEEEQFKTLLQSGIFDKEDELAPKDVDIVKTAIRAGFLSLDEKMRLMPEVVTGMDKSGTTAVCCLISPSHLYVANCGDSRGVLYRSSGIGFSTQDHKPFNPCEKERIQNAGGTVMIQRVNGSLAVSRALGDYEYKNVEGKSQCEQLVSPEPELYVERRAAQDEFLVLACDGIWDVMSNEDIGAYVRSRFLVTDDIQSITDQVIDTCFNKGSRDNMSIVILAFPNAPKVDPAALRKEQQLNTTIENKVTEFCKTPGPISLTQIIQMLDEENLQNLPPGGGLVSKQEFTESLFKKLRPDCANAQEGAPVMDECFSEEGDTGTLSKLLFLPSLSMRQKLANLLSSTQIFDDEDFEEELAPRVDVTFEKVTKLATKSETPSASPVASTSTTIVEETAETITEFSEETKEKSPEK